MAIKTIFLDRDGVINKEVGYLHKIENFKFINGVFSSCAHFQRLGYKIIIISNQSGISRGYFNENEYQALTSWMLKQFKKNDIIILDVYHCPHGPKSTCSCRKPKPGMLEKANRTHNIDFNNSWLIGDKETDIQAAYAAGIENTILVRSGHLINEDSSQALYIINSIKESTTLIAT